MTAARTLLFIVLSILTAACGHHPNMRTLDPIKDQALTSICNSPYVKLPHRFIHTIEATLPGGRTAVLLGITMADPAGKSLHSVLMTLEGLVLFDGKYDGALVVNRALAPFDKDSVDQNMMEDIKLLFLPPEDSTIAAGIQQDGSILCQRRGNRGETLEILIRPDRSWKMETYRTPFERLREVDASAVVDGIPGEMVLRSHTNGNYTLRMKLVGAEAVSGGIGEPIPKEATP